MKNESRKRFADCTESLDEVHDLIWIELQRAVVTPAHGWHFPVIGTSTGETSNLRTLVLRAVSVEGLSLTSFTDVRSEKIGQIRANSCLSWLFYDRDLRCQLRVMSRASIHSEDEIAEHFWQSSTLESRRCYLAPQAPRTEVPGRSINLPQEFQHRVPTEEEVQAGRENFAVISSQVTVLEWLFLQPTGNLSAKFEFDSTGLIKKSWLAP